MICWFSLTASWGQTSWTDAVLTQVANNNVRLKALAKSNEATIAERRTENTVGETAVEYSPFYQRGVSGLASSELIVSQEFDFPTLYGARRKSAMLQGQVLEQEYSIMKREVMTEAANLCYDLMTATEKAMLLKQRMAAADSLLAICNRRMEHGDATAMELNRVRMDRMNIMTEAVKNDGETLRIKTELQRMGVEVMPTDDEIMANTGAITLNTQKGQEEMLAETTVKMAKQDVRIQQQSWLPRLTVGYRRNTEVRESLNGFLVGVSMPLFSNKSKVKAARMRQAATEAEQQTVCQEKKSKQQRLAAEAATLKNLVKTYDTELMTQTLKTLMMAVGGGEISIAEYYIEADRIYSCMAEHIEAKNNLNKVTTELWNY